jgi:hypothetical protein
MYSLTLLLLLPLLEPLIMQLTYLRATVTAAIAVV